MTDEGKEREELLCKVVALFWDAVPDDFDVDWFNRKALALLREHDARIFEQAAKHLDEIADNLRARAATTRREWTGEGYSQEDNRANHADARRDEERAGVYRDAAAALRAQKGASDGA